MPWVRLPPQSPSRYIHRLPVVVLPLGPVAPAVSKSLHSRNTAALPLRRVRLPPQSPSRYIRLFEALGMDEGPVAPAVSKSLHSMPADPQARLRSGCPRSLQVATFKPNGTLCSA